MFAIAARIVSQKLVNVEALIGIRCKNWTKNDGLDKKGLDYCKFFFSILKKQYNLVLYSRKLLGDLTIA